MRRLTAPPLPDWAHVSDKRRSHVDRVVTLLTAWADAMELPDHEASRWLAAGVLQGAQAARRQPVAGEGARLQRLDRFHVVRIGAAGGHRDVRLIHGQLRKALEGIRLAEGRRLTSCTVRR